MEKAMLFGMALALASSAAVLGASPPAAQPLTGRLDLAGPVAPGTCCYVMETRTVQYQKDGVRGVRNLYRLYLRRRTEDDGEVFTCERFEISLGGGPLRTIPSLEGWSYTPALEGGAVAQGQVFGIPHEKFDGLADSTGAPLPPDQAYVVYNSFIDFHAIYHVFARPSPSGGGIQDLHRIGDRVVHAASGTKPPVNLGKAIKEGSYFQNGEVTLTLKGLTLVGGATCALVGYDSGDSKYEMFLEPAPDVQVAVKGASHYFGDIAVDLERRWVLAADMHEFTRSTVYLGGQETMNPVVERLLTLRAVPQQEFEQTLARLQGD